uniref:Uncharacterized protein n=1 Tax=Hyaloperonospora arabidopsidis (strain Emoy2) TaxID=559515 RepID=M4BJC8_HYAAE
MFVNHYSQHAISRSWVVVASAAAVCPGERKIRRDRPPGRDRVERFNTSEGVCGQGRIRFGPHASEVRRPYVASWSRQTISITSLPGAFHVAFEFEDPRALSRTRQRPRQLSWRPYANKSQPFEVPQLALRTHNRRQDLSPIISCVIAVVSSQTTTILICCVPAGLESARFAYYSIFSQFVTHPFCYCGIVSEKQAAKRTSRPRRQRPCFP